MQSNQLVKGIHFTILLSDMLFILSNTSRKKVKYSDALFTSVKIGKHLSKSIKD